jgi:hypothetical protein
MENKTVEKKVKISDLATQLEKGELKSGALDIKVLRQCALYFKTHGYTTEEISEILECDIRTVQRYTLKARKENISVVDLHFQKRTSGEFMNNLESQYQRILKLSYSKQLSDRERARVIYMLHQICVNGIDTLTKLGYLSQAQGIEDRKAAEKEYELVINNVRIKSALADLNRNSMLLQEFDGTPEEGLKLWLKICDEEKRLWQKLLDAYKSLFKSFETEKYYVGGGNSQNN